MIINEEMIKKLRSTFNLNIYEAKIWVALLSKGVASAGELADISNVPRSRSYDVLESLEKRGFIISKIGKPLKYIAVAPQDIIKRLKNKTKEESESALKTLDKVKKTDIFGELSLLFKNGINNVEVTSISGALKGRNNIYNYMESALSKAQKSVYISTTESGILRKARYLKRALQNNKDIDIRVLSPKTKESNKNLEELGKIAKMKQVKANTSRFIVIDDEEVIFMIEDDKATTEAFDNGIWIKSPFFAKSMSKLFNHSWKA